MSEREGGEGGEREVKEREREGERRGVEGELDREMG